MTHRKRAIPSDKSATGLTAIIQREREATALGETEVR